MADQPNSHSTKNSWNPFIPSERDIVRTDELASKNALIAGILTAILLPAGLLYLNRGINPLKILGYAFAATLTLSLMSKTPESASETGNSLGIIAGGVITAEQVIAINKARQRLKEKST